jgi:hypothetical protein
MLNMRDNPFSVLDAVAYGSQSRFDWRGNTAVGTGVLVHANPHPSPDSVANASKSIFASWLRASNIFPFGCYHC